MDFFEQAFGGGRRAGPRRGQDTQMELTISFFEAANGCEKTINSTYMARGAPTKNGKESKVKKMRKVEITIPAGVDTGNVRRYAYICHNTFKSVIETFPPYLRFS